MKYYLRRLAWIVFVLLIALTLADPGSRAVTDFVGEALPLTALFAIVFGSSTKLSRKVIPPVKDPVKQMQSIRREREQDAARRVRALIRANYSSRRDSEFDRRVAEIRLMLDTGAVTAAQAREMWHEAVLLGKDSPAAQVEELSEQYGLPVVTELKKPDLPDIRTTAFRLCYHEDGLPRYRNIEECPHHGGVPFSTAPPVSAGGLPVFFKPARELSESELEEIRARLPASLGKPVIVLSAEPDEDEVPGEDYAPGGDYAPAGQGEMLAELARVINAQAREHGRAGHYPSLRWFMSPAWLADVQKLENKAGQKLYETRRRSQARGGVLGLLYGYPVTVGESFGVPELREP